MRAHERRRLVLAATVTVIAFPALWLIEGGGADDSPSTTAPADDVRPDDSSDPGAPVFIDDSVPAVDPAVIDIAVPEAPGARESHGRATFKRYVDAPVTRPCTTTLAPPGVTLTVTNLDNGLSTTCTNTRFVSIPPGADIALDTTVYVAIAELVEAPVPVRLTW